MDQLAIPSAGDPEDPPGAKPRGWFAGLWEVPRGPWTRAAAAYSLLFLLVQVILGVNSPLGAALDIIAFLPISAAVSLALLAAARAAQVPDLRRGFGLFGASFALTTIGTVIWVWQEEVQHVDPTYSWSNLPYLLSYPLAILGVLAFPHRRMDRNGRWWLLLDGVMAVVAGVTVTWLLVVLPLAESDRDPLHRLLILAYPIGDLLIFAALVPLLLAPAARRRGQILPVLATGMALYLFADIAYQLGGPGVAYMRVDWRNLPFLAGYTMLVWAAEAHYRSPNGGTPSEETDLVPLPVRNPVPLLLGGIVYLLLLAAVFGGGDPSHSVLAVAAVTMTGLILIRESLTDREYRRVTRVLEARRAEERFLAIIRHLRFGVVVLGRDGQPAMVNQAALELLGVSRDELAGRSVFDHPWDVVREDGSPFAAEAYPAALAATTLEPVRNVVMGVLRRRTGDRVWLLVDAEPELDAAGGFKQTVVTLHDITDRRNLETRLRQAQRMEAVGQLAGGIAHDFNNLLTAVTGYSEILLESFAPDDSRRVEMQEIGKAAARAARLTQQLLAFGRRQLLQPVVLDAGLVVRDSERMLRRLLGEDIDFHLRIAPDLGRVRVDHGQLEQVIINLALNARDAMPRGGRLTITARNLEPGVPLPSSWAQVPPSGAVKLEVSDTGIGMDEATMARVFEPFFTTKEVGKGTGLGLATVYGIVRQSDGDIWIQSEPGKGTVVTVCFPRVDAPVPAGEAVAPAASARGSETILVVEDEPALVSVMRRALERQGYRVLVARGPEPARAVFESADPPVDLLLSDVVMPGGSGPELAAWARARRPNLAVLYVSGYASEEAVRYGVDLSDANLLAKPFRPDELVKLVRAVLDRSRSGA